MLVMSRKKNESIVIGNDVCITIVEIRGDKVRLGIELPREMPLHRKEVYDAIMSPPEPESQPAQIPPALENDQQTIRRLEQTIERQQQTIRRQKELLRSIEAKIQDHLQSITEDY